MFAGIKRFEHEMFGMKKTRFREVFGDLGPIENHPTQNALGLLGAPYYPLGEDDPHWTPTDVVAYFRPSMLGGGKLARLVVTYPDISETNADAFCKGLLAALTNGFGPPTREMRGSPDDPPEFRMTRMHVWVMPGHVIDLSLNIEPTKPPDTPSVAVGYGDPAYDSIAQTLNWQ